MTESLLCRVTPFGDPGITGCLLLPLDFRSLPRPSSPDSSKASSVDPYSLDHITVCSVSISVTVGLIVLRLPLPYCAVSEVGGAASSLHQVHRVTMTTPELPLLVSFFPFSLTGMFRFLLCQKIMAYRIRCRCGAAHRCRRAICGGKGTRTLDP